MHTIASAKLKRDSLEAGRNARWDNDLKPFTHSFPIFINCFSCFLKLPLLRFHTDSFS